jgi:MOSC domain-containing protein YiiM
MVELDSVEISTEAGVAGDFRGKPGARQITVLSAEQWNDACDDLGQEIPWTTRRANLLVEGITFANTKDSTLRVGDVVLKISGETEPCGRMDEQVMGLQEALAPDWRGGVCCRVIRGGSIAPGMQVVLDDSP